LVLFFVEVEEIMKAMWSPIVAGVVLICCTQYALAQGQTQTEKGTLLEAGKCKILVPGTGGFFPGRRDWSGPCVDGLATGLGLHRQYENDGKLWRIALEERSGGLLTNNIDMYSGGGGKIVRWRGRPGAQQKEDNFPPSQLPEWAREIVDGKPRTLAQAKQAAGAANASATMSKSQASGSGGTPLSAGVPTNRNRLFIAYGKDLARPFVVTSESMLQAVLSDYLRILNESRVNILSATDFRTEECTPSPGSGSLFAFVVYRHESQSGNSMAWGVVCGASSAEVAAKSAQRACEARSGRCNAPRAKASTFDSNSVQLIIGDLRVPGENKTMKQISVQLSESRPDSGGRNVGDIVRWDFYSNISSGFICDWFNGAWSNGRPDLMIYGNGPFFKDQATRSRDREITYRCSNFL
jgi:hypothetical protein